MTEKYDVIILGAGPGGYVAAIRAKQLGLKTLVVEANHLGGTCLNWGCIPTKALLKAAEKYYAIKHAEDFGISVKSVTFDFKKMVANSRANASQLSKGIAHLLKKNKVEHVEGYGKITGKDTIKVGDKSYSAKNIIISTGASPRVIAGLEHDGENVLNYKHAMTLSALPKSLLVIGSGAIGIEFASFYNMLGVEVTVVEIADQILPVEDEEISAMARKAFESRGIKIFSKSQAKIIKRNKGDVEVEITSAGKTTKHKFNKVLAAVGIEANVKDIGLEKTKAKVERGLIVTNNNMQTNEANVYAIGDVTAGPWLAHKASHEGILAVEHIAGKKTHPIAKENIPGCTYCYPQIASIGLTEKKAKEAGYSIKVGRFPFMANGKAITMHETEGLIKTIFDAKTGELLGAHMVGAEVTEMIQGFAIAKSAELTEEDIMHTVFPHPTLSEMMHESVLDAFERALHI